MKAIEKAFSEYAIKEFTGKQDNPEVLKYFNDLGFDGSALKDETAWCAAFVNWCNMKTGYEYTGKLNARSFLEIGQDVSIPEFGDIVVFWRSHPDSWMGHVAYFVAERYGYIYVLGGNQNNQVKISAYPKKRLLSYRRLKSGL